MELAQDACQRMKAECEFVAVKWDDLVPGLLDKKFDIVMSSLEVNNERRRRLGMSRRYYLSPGAFIAAKGQPFDGPSSLLRNKKIGVQKDSTHADWLDKSFRRSAQIKRYASPPRRWTRLPRDEIDAVFGDKVQLWAVVAEARGQVLRGDGSGRQGHPDPGRRRVGRHPPRGRQAARRLQQGAG
jgi:ABC-type amino acid transport substrate-binding protein